MEYSTCAKGALHQTDNLAKLRRESLSLLELIAKIFCAVEIARTSEALGNTQTRVAVASAPFEFSACVRSTPHQADNLAKLWQEFLFLLELIAKILCAVEIARTSAVNGNRHGVYVSI